MTSLRRVAVRVPAADLEKARARFIELAPAGFEEIELDLLLDAGHAEVELAAYVDDDVETAFRAHYPDATGRTIDPGWEDAWRAFHRPARAGGIWIVPPWEPAPPGEAAVVIDPGRAFGTGAHPTTRLCVELLARVEPSSLLDIGCGSGVLSIAAARLGYGPIVAVDDDEVAVEVTRENARVNAVELEAVVADATSDPLPGAEVAVVNVLLAPVEAILARLPTRTAITSGYLEGERPEHAGWEHAERLGLDGWAADLFRRSTV